MAPQTLHACLRAFDTNVCLNYGHMAWKCSFDLKG